MKQVLSLVVCNLALMLNVSPAFANAPETTVDTKHVETKQVETTEHEASEHQHEDHKHEHKHKKD